MAEAKLYIEHNATDEDTGVHGIFGDDGWSLLCITDPDDRVILRAEPQEQLGDLGLADLFFESREPENDEYSIDDLRADFPEGDYTVGVVDYEGNPRARIATFSHDIPAEPSISSPALVEEPEETEAGLPIDGLVVEWEPVTETLDGGPLSVTGYEVIVTDEEYEDPNGFSKPVYDVHVPPDVTSLPVPASFLQPDTVYELEVLVLGESGNQTISLGFFRTE